MNAKLMILSCLALAGTAMAQPATFTDLGDRSSTQSFTQMVTSLGGPDIQWFRIQLPAVLPVSGWVDIWTTPTGDSSTDMTDTEMGMYDNDGNGASTTWNDDDAGPGLYSQLSYGSIVSRGVTTYAGQTNGNDRNGSGGPLAGGVYWVAVGRFNVNWTLGFGAGGTSTSPQTTAMLNFDISNPSDPFPPSGTGTANPDTASAGDSVLFTVTTTPGGNPLSTGIAVSGDLSSIGGSSTTAFHDDGLDGDLLAGDGTFSFQYTLPATTGDLHYSVPVAITDAQSRTGNTTITGTTNAAVSWDEATMGDAGQTFADPQTPVGTGPLNVIVGNTDDSSDGADVYKIQICDSANFSASTEFSTGNPDTQLFLFDANGMGVSCNDDTPAGVGVSRIDNTGVTADGVYYIGVSRYNVDPMDASGELLFLNTPFNTIHTPDGPAAANPFDHFDVATSAFSTGAYRLSFTGACFPSSTPPQCSIADVGVAGGGFGHDNRLDNNDFISFITLFFAQDPIADMGAAGGLPGSDGAWDNNDFIAFINHFFADSAACNG